MRRRPALVWLGATVVIACAVGFAALLGQAGRKTPVLVVVRPVPAGQVLAQSDLRKVELGVADAAGHVVPAAQAASVVGKVATVPLVAGSLLAPEQVGESSEYPPQGRSRVSFAVGAGDLPAGVTVGQRVAVLPGRFDAEGGAGSADAEEPLVGVVTDAIPGEGASEPTVLSMLVDTAAARRAVRVDKPHVVVLSPVGREVP
ncbi:SAF domain-containing protein [Actinacidiphila sp. bgisy167]|uniref:SAF domain-containing protein n=1 Tax=Actinacidiphila sp. bgisy167 TaxID=3413797 RepID=UPI003D73F7AB